MIYSDNCDWAEDAELFAEGHRLRPGLLHLLRGTALLRFDGGAELLLTGEAKLRLENEGSAELMLGYTVVRAEEGANGFALMTLASPMIDLGTEFAARVGQNGDTELHVLDGRVEYRDIKSPLVLTAGNAIRFDSTTSAARSVPLNSSRFAELIKKSKPRPMEELMWAYDGFHYTSDCFLFRKVSQAKAGTAHGGSASRQNDVILLPRI